MLHVNVTNVTCSVTNVRTVFSLFLQNVIVCKREIDDGMMIAKLQSDDYDNDSVIIKTEPTDNITVKNEPVYDDDDDTIMS